MSWFPVVSVLTPCASPNTLPRLLYTLLPLLSPVSNQSRMTSHQMVERQRLLQQQQHQRLLVNQRQPAAEASVSTFQNIDNILNSTPPNVSLQVGLQVGPHAAERRPALPVV